MKEITGHKGVNIQPRKSTITRHIKIMTHGDWKARLPIEVDQHMPRLCPLHSIKCFCKRKLQRILLWISVLQAVLRVWLFAGELPDGCVVAVGRMHKTI